MPKIKKTVWLWQCNRCGYEWLPRDGDTDTPPKRCPGPNCKSPYWNTPRQQPKPDARKGK
jgi:predicted Zn-ribbon and HTH transcriptional regulator